MTEYLKLTEEGAELHGEEEVKEEGQDAIVDADVAPGEVQGKQEYVEDTASLYTRLNVRASALRQILDDHPEEFPADLDSLLTLGAVVCARAHAYEISEEDLVHLLITFYRDTKRMN